MNNLLTRTLSGAVFVVLVIGSILLDPLVFAGLFFMITILGLWEIYGIFRLKAFSPNRWIGTIVGGLLYLSICLIHPALGKYFFDLDSFMGAFAYVAYFAAIVLFLILVLFVLMLAEIFRKQDHPFENVALTFLGIIYVALPLGLLNSFFYINPTSIASPNILLGVFLLIWVNDTFAYLSGMSFGKHPLYPRLSPKKTWEGSIGGAIFALMTAFLLSTFFKTPGTLVWLIVGMVCIIFGTLGDLAESMLKRSFNIKDSGNIMPGHGGILDRFDAVLMATPFVLLILFITSL